MARACLAARAWLVRHTLRGRIAAPLRPRSGVRLSTRIGFTPKMRTPSTHFAWVKAIAAIGFTPKISAPPTRFQGVKPMGRDIKEQEPVCCFSEGIGFAPGNGVGSRPFRLRIGFAPRSGVGSRQLCFPMCFPPGARASSFGCPSRPGRPVSCLCMLPGFSPLLPPRHGLLAGHSPS